MALKRAALSRGGHLRHRVAGEGARTLGPPRQNGNAAVVRAASACLSGASRTSVACPGSG